METNKQYLCPICKKNLDREDVDEFYCRANKDDHFFGQVVDNNEITMMKVRFSEDGNRLSMKINITRNKTEIWKNGDKHFIIDEAFIPEFTDLEKIKSKIKTCLLFA